MQFANTPISGLVHCTAPVHRDARGFFSRTFDAAVARGKGLEPDAFVQDNLSRSSRGVVRGPHVRVGRGKAKLVRGSQGRIFDVVVDPPPGSPTYQTWQAFELDGESQASIYIPPGCAHGFQALSELVDTAYRVDRAHDPSENRPIAHDDPELASAWPLQVTLVPDVDRGAAPLSAPAAELRRVAAAS